MYFGGVDMYNYSGILYKLIAPCGIFFFGWYSNFTFE